MVENKKPFCCCCCRYAEEWQKFNEEWKKIKEEWTGKRRKKKREGTFHWECSGGDLKKEAKWKEEEAKWRAEKERIKKKDKE